jgi:hypothetical protein
MRHAALFARVHDVANRFKPMRRTAELLQKVELTLLLLAALGLSALLHRVQLGLCGPKPPVRQLAIGLFRAVLVDVIPIGRSVALLVLGQLIVGQRLLVVRPPAGRMTRLPVVVPATGLTNEVLNLPGQREAQVSQPPRCVRLSKRSKTHRLRG